MVLDGHHDMQYLMECSKTLSCNSLEPEADVENNKEKIRRMNLEITERELAILSVAVTEMQRAGWTPFVATFFIQVALGIGQ